jgi:hypothetical protein
MMANSLYILSSSQLNNNDKSEGIAFAFCLFKKLDFLAAQGILGCVKGLCCFGYFVDWSGRCEILENAFAFPRAVCFQRCLFKVLRECGSMGDPAGLMLEEAPGPPAESEHCERKSTGNLYKAKYSKICKGIILKAQGCSTEVSLKLMLRSDSFICIFK